MAGLHGKNDFNSLIAQVPTGVNPFDYFLKMIDAIYFPSTSSETIKVLKIFLAFHALVALACLALLLLPYLQTRQNYQWFIRKLYMTHQGRAVHPTPLYLINSRVFMAASQLIGSLSTQGYIMTSIRSGQSVEYAKTAPTITLVALMYLFEFWAYWVMAWCLIYTTLPNKQSYVMEVNRRKNLMTNPTTLTLLPVIFFILVTVLSVIFVILLMHTQDQEIHQWNQFEDLMLQGAQLYNQMHNATDPNANLALERLLVLQKNLIESGSRLEAASRRLLDSFQLMAATWIPILCITLAIFVASVWTLLECLWAKIPINHRSFGAITGFNCLKFDAAPAHTVSSGEGSTISQKSTLEGQFFYLSLRAAAMTASIICSIAVMILAVVRIKEINTMASWRSQMTWMILCSGLCSGITIVLQCWRIYLDEKAAPLHTTQTTGDCCDASQDELFMQPSETRTTVRSDKPGPNLTAVPLSASGDIGGAELNPMTWIQIQAHEAGQFNLPSQPRGHPVATSLFVHFVPSYQVKTPLNQQSGS